VGTVAKKENEKTSKKQRNEKIGFRVLGLGFRVRVRFSNVVEKFFLFIFH